MDEFITGVEGYSDHVFVHQLTFVTNKRESSLCAATETETRADATLDVCREVGPTRGSDR